MVYLHPLISLFLLGLPLPPSFLRAVHSCPHPALSPVSPRARNSCAARSIRASPGLSHNGVPPSQGKSLYSRSPPASARPQAGRPGLGEGSMWPSGRPLQEEGPGPGRKDGRQLGGQELSPSRRGTLAGGWREEGPDGGLPATRTTASRLDGPRSQAPASPAGRDLQKSPVQAEGQKSPTTHLRVEELPAMAP